MSEKILVIDDERDIANLLEVYLQNENYIVYKYYCAKDAMPCIENEDIDLAILDVMLPDMDGFSLCQLIREKYTYPIIMLTAKIEETDKITGLTLGADDYVSLTPTEFSILNVLLKNAGTVVSIEDLFHAVWKDEYYSKNSSTITVHIRHLREKLKDTSDTPKYIKTIWGVGYKI